MGGILVDRNSRMTPRSRYRKSGPSLQCSTLEAAAGYIRVAVDRIERLYVNGMKETA